jgi:hypothetical protein
MKSLKQGDTGEDVINLQLILSGFKGSVTDGDFGPHTEYQVKIFQKHFMEDASPDGIVGPKTIKAIKNFSQKYPLDFSRLKCNCGVCSGFGQGYYKGVYRNNKSNIERYHKYEYPGIHKAILWTQKAACFYLEVTGLGQLYASSGYRCSINNIKKRRTSTNHHGKAIDSIVLREDGIKLPEKLFYNKIRAIIQGVAGSQIGWVKQNKKSLEPSSIAPTWIHHDIRCFEKKYLKDHFFVTSEEELNKEVLSF